MAHATLKNYFCPRCGFKRQILINTKMPRTILCRNCGHRYGIESYHEIKDKPKTLLYGVRG